MLVDYYTEDEFWNLEKPTIPQRCQLFPLEPIGIGTLYMESLSGYIARLADYHTITAEELILSKIIPLMGHKTSSASSINIINHLFGVQDSLTTASQTRVNIATTLIQVLEELTQRQDLSCLWPLKWASIFFGFSILRLHQAWCPVCYDTWRTNNRVIYNPLLWLVNTIKECPHHEYQSLIEQCPHCQQEFPPLSRYSRPGYCSICHLWLGGLQLNQVVNEETESVDFWRQQLIAPLSNQSNKPLWQCMWFDDVEDLAANTPSNFLPPIHQN
ncbi:TniQ family protein [Nostoc sp. LEGE 12450]|uniref:TniQ family protein n=1 Tax=Nostoc sp. LEGE 12450 TaxID=1828643 RepID=UPI00187F33B2|nr:TniQ family protein [Nostoc sp. LEGE 12450]MBE8989980.1 TniQ family protein [Nostoc sp. LEGE 12450]